MILFLASFPTVLQAQVFPTSATVRLVPPYNTFLSELSQGNSDKVQVILLQRDQSVPSYDVRLKFKVKLAGNVIFETAPSFVSPIINLEQNTPIVLSGADLATYFQANNLVFGSANLRNIYVNNGQVPEGLYEFCATVYSATRADRQLSNNACQIFSLSRSLPPLLNLPACGGAIPEQNPLNLRFWWTPQHNSSVNSAANTSYVLEIFEIRNLDGNANNAVLSSSPVFSFPTPLTQYFYSISDPNFIVGMRYGWRVRVIDESNRDAFINNGYSAVCAFTYAPTLSNGQTLVPILAPANIQAEGKGNRAGRVWWSAFAGATPATASDRPDRYKVEYKKVGVGLEWFSEFTTTNELLINQGLEPATTYEARVQGEKGGFLGESSSIVTFTTFIPVAAVCGVTPTNVLENMTPMRNARIGMPIEITGFEVVLDSLQEESTPGVYSGRGLIKIPFMLNQTFTVLFESLFINELGQAGEGKVWFKTKPIEEWIAENTPPISEQPISFMDFEPGTTVFPVVITGIVVLPNGQVTVVTPNGTFLADTTLIPRPVLKPTVIEDKNGNQFIVHPDGTVTNLGQAGFIPKPMTTEEKLDKIRRGLYLEALKDYKTQIETYYTSKNEPIPTRGPNHNQNIIIDLPECIGTEANEIKDNFLAIKDNVNKKELREKSLKRILGTTKKTTLDFIAQKALDSLTKMPKITATEFQKFLTNTQFKTEKDSVCGEWRRIESNKKGNYMVYNNKKYFMGDTIFVPQIKNFKITLTAFKDNKQLFKPKTTWLNAVPNLAKTAAKFVTYPVSLSISGTYVRALQIDTLKQANLPDSLQIDSIAVRIVVVETIFTENIAKTYGFDPNELATEDDYPSFLTQPKSGIKWKSIRDNNTFVPIDVEVKPAGSQKSVSFILTDSLNFRLQTKTIKTANATIFVAGSLRNRETAIIPRINGTKNDTMQIKVKCYSRVKKTVAVTLVHEQNDDIQLIPVGTITDTPTTRVVGWGGNRFMDTVPLGDDRLIFDPIVRDSVIVAGSNLLCETVANDQNVLSTDNMNRVNLQTTLNDIYGQGIVEWTVDPIIYVKIVNFDFNRDRMINVNNFTNREVRRVIDTCRITAGNVYNLYLVNNPIDGSNGMMDMGTRNGFIHPDRTTVIYQTCSHELGHGAFSLQHPFHQFPNFPQGEKDILNIMNYGTVREKLRKYQWDFITR